MKDQLIMQKEVNDEATPLALTVTEKPAVIYLGAVPVRDDEAMLAKASAISKQLTEIIDTQRLFTTIGRKKHVNIEGWTTLLAMIGVVPVEVSVERTPKGSYTATVELQRIDTGQVITRASAECGIDEREWANRKSYARRSMALTRATGKAARLAYSWIIVMAGYSPTPMEEMPNDDRQRQDDFQRLTDTVEMVNDQSPPDSDGWTREEPLTTKNEPTPPKRSLSLGSYGSPAQIKRAFAIIKSAENKGMPREEIDALLLQHGCVDEEGKPSSRHFPSRDVYQALLDDKVGIIAKWPKEALNNEQQNNGHAEFAEDDIPF